MTAKQQAENLIKTFGSKDLAKKVCEELAKRLPNINLVPCNSRMSDDYYLQYWTNNVPNQIDKL